MVVCISQCQGMGCGVYALHLIVDIYILYSLFSRFSIIISFSSPGGTAKMGVKAQLHLSGDKTLQAATIPSPSLSLSWWQAAHCCQARVGNPHSDTENVYCGGRTFALWSHLLPVTSRFLIFYHRKFLVDHKSSPLSAAAGGEKRCAAPWGWAAAARVQPSTCALQNADCVLFKQCSSELYRGAKVTRTIIVLHFMQTKKNVLEDVLCIVTRYCKIIFRLRGFEALGNTTV